MKIYSHILLVFFLLLFNNIAGAKIVLPSFFCDNMVLQQQSNVPIWGKSEKNSNIILFTSWNKKTSFTKADENGRWKIFVQTPKAGGPFTLTIKDKETVILSNVMIGEVWFCSGQSNMEMPMRGFKNQPVLNSNEILITADNSNLRLLTINRNASINVSDTCSGKWQISNSETAKEFSAVAYQYGAMLQKKLNIPVGIIVSCWGGTTIQSWMSEETLNGFSEIKKIVISDSTKDKHKFSSTLFNGMIAPIVGYGIKGFLWYQGESNRHEPELYGKLFPAMVTSWRNLWDTKTILPFYYVQIAPFGGKDTTRSGKHLREAQLKAMKSIPDAGMAVTLDIGDETFIHFPDKTTVAKRLLYWALAKTYNYKGIEYSGPVYKYIKIENNKVNVYFDYTENGLTSFGKELQNFEIAGANKIFYPAMAKINDDKSVQVSNDEVKNPAAVRYAFKEYVKGDLYNNAGLPASSFRTDNW